MKITAFKPVEFNFFNDGIQYVYEFPNRGIRVSVILTPYSYGGKKGYWEMGIFQYGELAYENDITGYDAVRGWLTWEEVQNNLKKIEERGLQPYVDVV